VLYFETAEGEMQRAQTVLSGQLSITVDLQKEEADQDEKNEK
jgi:hypothetical protein